MKTTVTLEIAGAKYRFVADADEDRLQALASLINDRVGEKAHRGATPSHLLAMAALSLADDLLAAQDRLKQIDALTRGTLTEAISRIDRRLAQDNQAG